MTLRYHAGIVAAAFLILTGLLDSGGEDRREERLPREELSLASAVVHQQSAASLAPYLATPPEVVNRMLTLADVSADDVVYDLGCGDGRIPIAAAVRYGARGVGVDIDASRLAEARDHATRAGVAHLVTFKHQDALSTDLSDATVVTLYLLAASNLKLRPMLVGQLRAGARVVSHNFSMGDWQADKVDTFADGDGVSRTLYLWTIRPALTLRRAQGHPEQRRGGQHRRRAALTAPGV